jgi:hypothetical protein
MRNFVVWWVSAFEPAEWANDDDRQPSPMTFRDFHRIDNRFDAVVVEDQNKSAKTTANEKRYNRRFFCFVLFCFNCTKRLTTGLWNVNKEHQRVIVLQQHFASILQRKIGKFGCLLGAAAACCRQQRMIASKLRAIDVDPQAHEKDGDQRCKRNEHVEATESSSSIFVGFLDIMLQTIGFQSLIIENSSRNNHLSRAK